MAVESGTLTIVNLRDGGAAIRLLFPELIDSTTEANYETIETSGGLKPLFYQNREPEEIRLDELLLDGTRGNNSVEPQLEKLKKLLVADGQTGAPPPLQVIAGSWTVRCVLANLRVKRTFFTPDGQNCIRAFVDLTFLEIRGLTVPAGGRRLGGLGR